MTTTTITVEFHGETYTRTTEATYTHAAYKAGRVTFHKTETAAKRTGGEVKVVAGTRTPETCIVCGGTGTIEMRTATRGMVEVPCYGPVHH